MLTAKILIFDEEFLVASDLKTQLTKLGYEILELFSTAETGLAYMEKNLGTEYFPEAVVLDVNLRGEIKGVEAARIISEKYDIGVVFLAGLGNLEDIDKIYRNRPVPFLIKPFDIYLVHVAIQQSMYQASLEKQVKEFRQEKGRISLPPARI
jgi:DNA-binding NtrC family response regulator